MGEELDVDALLSGIAAEDKQKRQQTVTDAAWSATVTEFKALSEAIHDDNKRQGSSAHSQPWRS